jgi:hypothetical protein
MALFLLENRDFLSFRMIFKVWLNQIFSNFSTMLWTIKYRLSSITVYLVERYFYFHPETFKVSIFSEKKGHNSWTVNVNFTIIEFNLYFMVHRIALKFEKIWSSRTLNIIRGLFRFPDDI